MSASSHTKSVKPKSAVRYAPHIQSALETYAKGCHNGAERHKRAANKRNTDKEGKLLMLHTAASNYLREAAFHRILGNEQEEKLALNEAKNTMEMLKIATNPIDSDRTVESLHGELTNMYMLAKTFREALQDGGFDGA